MLYVKQINKVHKVNSYLNVISQINCGKTLKNATNRSAMLKCTIIRFILLNFFLLVPSTKRTTEFPITAQANSIPETKISTRAKDSFLPSDETVPFPVPVEFVHKVFVTLSQVMYDVIGGSIVVTDAIFEG